MSWTTPANITAIAPSKNLTLPADEKLQSYIDNLERQIKRHFPRIDERIIEGDITVEDIADNVSTIVIEYLLSEGNPYAQETQSYGNAVSRTVITDGSARRTLRLTEADFALFAPRESGETNAMSINIAMNADMRDFDDDEPHSWEYKGYWKPTEWVRTIL
jgi:hypothetical protein